MKTRQYILEATERAIQSKGLARVTTKEIAKEAGCAEGTLYKHFVDKEDLFLAVIQENLPDLVATVHEEQAGKGTVGDNLVEMAYAIIHYYEQLIPLAVSLFADTDLLVRHREWMQKQNTGPQRLYERVAAYIEAEQHLGRLDPSTKAMNIATLLLGSCFQYVFFRLFMGKNLFPMTDQQFVTDLVQSIVKNAQG